MHLTLHLTPRCNMRCSYCYACPHDGPDMSLDTAVKAVGMGRAMSSQDDSLGVIFFGGEPLLKRDLIRQIVRECRKIEAATGQQFYHKITTNGLLLDEEFLTDEDTRDIFVALSHDGVPQAHDLHRRDAGGKPTSAALDGKIDLLLSHRPYAPVLMVVRPDTACFFADSVEYLFERGFRYIISSLDYSADWDDEGMQELGRQYERLSGWYERLTNDEEKFYFSPFEVKIGSHVRPESCDRERCELGMKQISVAPEGKLYPCVQFVGDDDYCIGDIESGIDPNRRFELFRRSSAEKTCCEGCEIRQRCNHTCGCLNRQATGSIDTVSPALCAHERLVLEIADRLAERLYASRSAMFIQKSYNEMFPLLSLVEDSAPSS